MKTLQFIKPIVLFFYVSSCANNQNQTKNISGRDSLPVTNIAAADTFETGKIISPVFCKTDPAESYALYIPSKKNNEPMPVVYFFDPHGAGELPLTIYKSLADMYGFILIGSNNSKNGNEWSSEEKTWNNLLNDTKNRLPVSTGRIYVCGFSGGAKVATYLGLNHNEVEGVIAAGAGLPDIIKATGFHFSFTAVTGRGDMNMTDLVSINTNLDKTRASHRIIFFNGKHEWAPANTMNIVFSGLQFDAMREKLIAINPSLISEYIMASKKRVNDFLKTNNYTYAESECSLSINLLDRLTDSVNWFKEKNRLIKNSTAYQKQKQAEDNLIAAEQSLKDSYVQHFQDGDMNYWTKTISDIQTQAKAQTATGAMYQRLQAYLSLAFYSISNQLINSNRNTDAQYFVELYKMDDATNSEAWYFSAILNARKNDPDAAEKDLLKAVENGFTDKNRMMLQPEFKIPGINLSGVAGKMKN